MGLPRAESLMDRPQPAGLPQAPAEGVHSRGTGWAQPAGWGLLCREEQLPGLLRVCAGQGLSASGPLPTVGSPL